MSTGLEAEQSPPVLGKKGGCGTIYKRQLGRSNGSEICIANDTGQKGHNVRTSVAAVTAGTSRGPFGASASEPACVKEGGEGGAKLTKDN